MTIREKKIKAIYEKIANKKLSLWCKVLLKFGTIETETIIQDKQKLRSGKFTFEENIHKIIGHPVMIGDVIDFIEKNTQGVKPEQTKWEGVIKIQLWCSRGKAIELFTEHIIFVWQNKRFPIEEQPDECIDFVYSLIS